MTTDAASIAPSAIISASPPVYPAFFSHTVPARTCGKVGNWLKSWRQGTASAAKKLRCYEAPPWSNAPPYASVEKTAPIMPSAANALFLLTSFERTKEVSRGAGRSARGLLGCRGEVTSPCFLPWRTGRGDLAPTKNPGAATGGRPYLEGKYFYRRRNATDVRPAAVPRASAPAPIHPLCLFASH